MDNFLNGGVNELEQAKAAILALDKKKNSLEAAEKAMKAKQKDAEAQRKFMNDKINSSIKSRRGELEKIQNAQVSEARKDLKTADRKKKDAKEIAVNNRISGETQSLIKDNKNMAKQIRTLLKEAKLPAFANSSFYLAMFFPKTGKDILVIILTILIVVAAIPNIACLFIQETIIKVIVYIAIVLFFALIYFLFFTSSRGTRKAAAIAKTRAIRKQIKANKKIIKKTSKKIRKDSDETSYGLSSFDTEISQATSIVKNRENSRDLALNNFDKNIAPEMKAQIEAENLPIIEKLETEAKSLTDTYLKKLSDYKSFSSDVTNNYISFLGNKFSSPEKIDELISIIKQGRAQNVMQAIDAVKNER